MIFRVLTSLGLKHLHPNLLQITAKKNNLFFSLFFSHIQLRKSTNSASVADDNVFESVIVQKYLNYISKEDCAHINRKEREELIRLLDKRKEIEEELKSLEALSSEDDKELEKLIETDKKQCLESLQQIQDEILICLTPNEENDDRNVELKVIPGIGGEEAKIFAKELIEMYLNYANYKNWEYTFEVENDFILIMGVNVFGNLKYEGGIHRVQRVPATEHSGRMHTSTCSVVLLPQPKPYEVQISEKDLVIEKMRSSGPGGQNVNKRETCVRVKHIPTGIAIEDQTSRYQYSNLKSAINRLRSILFNMEQEKHSSERKTLKKEQIGTFDYADKIRTYHFAQNRVTDHRINYSIQNLKGFMSGGKELDYFISKVKHFHKNKELLLHIKNILESAEYKSFEKRQTK